MASVTIDEHELLRILDERQALRDHVTSLQADATAKTNASLGRCVRAFHEKFGHPVRSTPAVPTEEEVRFRLSLIVEEVEELLVACLDGTDVGLVRGFDDIRNAVNGPYPFHRAKVRVDLPEAYDALLDIAYVVEGTHAVFGTLAAPGLAEVQRANMAKDPVYVELKDAHHMMDAGTLPPGARHAFVTRRGSGPVEAPDPKAKPKKPVDWKAPDIRGVLLAQGWVP